MGEKDVQVGETEVEGFGKNLLCCCCYDLAMGGDLVSKETSVCAFTKTTIYT